MSFINSFTVLSPSTTLEPADVATAIVVDAVAVGDNAAVVTAINGALSVVGTVVLSPLSDRGAIHRCRVGDWWISGGERYAVAVSFSIVVVTKTEGGGGGDDDDPSAILAIIGDRGDGGNNDESIAMVFDSKNCGDDTVVFSTISLLFLPTMT